MEVGPRDGLQNEKMTVPLETKIELIRRLAGTGVRSIEAGSFVARKWVPQVCHCRVTCGRLTMVLSIGGDGLANAGSVGE